MISETLLNRINELARKDRSQGLNATEKAEQLRLRQEYLRLFREGLRQTLDSIEIVDSDQTKENES